MNAIIYTRFSPRRKADESESCQIQEGICRGFAKQKNLDVVAVFHDEDISGKDEYREKLWQAIEALPRGGALLVYKRDRLARNVYLSEQVERAVESRGARIVAVSGDVEGAGAEQTLIRQILASIAEFERKMIAARTSHAMKQHQKNGKRMGRYAPYGYRVDPHDSTMLEPIATEQEAVEVIRELHKEGECPNAITRTMNQAMPEAARGKEWRSKTVTKIIGRI